jgi:hypothetical protein
MHAVSRNTCTTTGWSRPATGTVGFGIDSYEERCYVVVGVANKDLELINKTVSCSSIRTTRQASFACDSLCYNHTITTEWRILAQVSEQAAGITRNSSQDSNSSMLVPRFSLNLFATGLIHVKDTANQILIAFVVLQQVLQLVVVEQRLERFCQITIRPFIYCFFNVTDDIERCPDLGMTGRINQGKYDFWVTTARNLTAAAQLSSSSESSAELCWLLSYFLIAYACGDSLLGPRIQHSAGYLAKTWRTQHMNGVSRRVNYCLPFVVYHSNK